MEASKKAQRYLQVKIILSALLWFFSLVLIAVIISFARQLSSVQTQKEYILKEISNSNSILSDVDLLKENNDQYTQNTLKNEMDAKDVVELQRSYWSYSLKINGHEITSNSVSVNPGTVTITLSESEQTRVLPLQMHMMGSVTGVDENDYYYKHLITSTTEKNVVAQHFDVNSLERYSTFTFTATSGEELKISVSEILAERLGLENKYITLTIN